MSIEHQFIGKRLETIPLERIERARFLRKNWDVYGILDSMDANKNKVLRVAREAFESGVKVLQLRDKKAEEEDLISIGAALMDLAKEYGAALIVNDSIEIAKHINAHGVHLGQADVPIQKARELLGSEKLVGISVHSVEEAIRAVTAGADYLGINGVFPSRTKPELTPLGLQMITNIRITLPDVPLIGIGGIRTDNASTVVAAGADGVAVISALFGTDSISQACHELQQAVATGKNSSF